MSSVWDREITVDLGEDFDPVDTRSRSLSRWTTVRLFRRLVPLCATVLLVAASASVPATPLRLVAYVPVGVDASVMIAGGTLYVYDASVGDNRIRAYGLGARGLRWSASTPEVASETTMRVIAGRLIVSMVDTDVDGEHTVAFDTRTGRRLWTSDLGYAVPAAGGVLVAGTPRPAGYNYPGTVASASYRLLDAGTGHVRWSVDVPDNCVTDTGSATSGPVTTLLELCPNTSALTEIDLADGRTIATREVYLGHPADNFRLPPQDQMVVPQLVLIGDTVLVAHANAPTPTIDAYALGDLRQRWTGLQVVEGQDVDQCGTELCVVGLASVGSVVDLLTGHQIGVIAPPTPSKPAGGSLVFVPVRPAVALSDVVALPRAGAGVGVSLPGPIDTRAPPSTVIVLARWDAVGVGGAEIAIAGSGSARAAPIEILPGVASWSCLTIAGDIVCATAGDHISVWQPR